jgi:hypothetical protein
MLTVLDVVRTVFLGSIAVTFGFALGLVVLLIESCLLTMFT